MNGTLSQFVALASAANGVIAGCFDPLRFYPNHADFKFCNSVRFVAVKNKLLGGSREVQRYATPNEWLASLNQNALRAWLTFSEPNADDAPNQQSPAFVGGGGDWQLVIAEDSRTEYWNSRWDVTKQNASDNRIWGVTYGCVDTVDQNTAAPCPDITAAASRLRRASMQRETSH